MLVAVALRPGQRAPKLAKFVTEENEVLVNAWVKISADNKVTAIVAHSEMGQGAQTALAQMLADELPPLSGNVVDLGAGWGFLSAMLAKMPSVSKIDLVEADQVALNCAHRNVTDKRAHFHWADATNWSTENRVDAVVMNPPFHNGRASDPTLGKTFISAAARLLAPSGKLWMVANRHLPYETTLSEAFVSVSEVSGDSRFKIFRAERPVRNGSRQSARSAIRRRR